MLFFTDTATPEIYTSLHTLSLPDALPISAARATAAGSAPRAPRRRCRWRTARRLSCSRPDRRRSRRRRRRNDSGRRRAEEHTSELQSLMHILYAVFCLIKKTYVSSLRAIQQYVDRIVVKPLLYQ